MARYNEILTGRFNRFMQKIFSMKGPASLVTLSDEMRAVFPLFNGAENRYLESWNRFIVSETQGAVAAQNTALRFRNPIGSNVICVIEKFGALVSAADQLNIFFNTAVAAASDVDLASFIGGTAIDARGPGGAVCRGSTGNNFSTAGLNFVAVITATTANQKVEFVFTDDQELVLLPGTQLHLATNSVNESIRCDLIWRERSLEESERA